MDRTLAKENLITNSHLLTMTSGIEDIEMATMSHQQVYNIKQMWNTLGISQCICKLQDVVAKATKQTWITISTLD
jgi:CubicO group peptidase (beta-lactamase class C family)